MSEQTNNDAENNDVECVCLVSAKEVVDELCDKR